MKGLKTGWTAVAGKLKLSQINILIRTENFENVSFNF